MPERVRPGIRRAEPAVLPDHGARLGTAFPVPQGVEAVHSADFGDTVLKGLLSEKSEGMIRRFVSGEQNKIEDSKGLLPEYSGRKGRQELRKGRREK